MNIFHLLHEWHLLRELGLGVGLSAGLILGVETQHFPFWAAVGALTQDQGNLSIEGSQIIYSAQEWRAAAGASILDVPPQLVTTRHTLDLGIFLGWVIGCCILGQMLTDGASKKIEAQAKSKSINEREQAQKQTVPEQKNESDGASPKNDRHA